MRFLLKITLKSCLFLKYYKIEGGKIYNKKYAFIFCIALILIFSISSVSAQDLNDTCTNTNLLNDKQVLSTQNLADSSDSISGFHASDENNYSNETNYNENILQDALKQTSLSGNNSELYYNEGFAFNVALSDDDGFLLANQRIIFTINGRDYFRTTNDQGIASININL